MVKIPFNVKFKPQIEYGEYKVVYVENSSMEQYPVEILKWDSNSDAGCIVGCIRHKGKWFLIKLNIFKYTFFVNSFVYIDNNENITKKITDKIKWLKTIKVKCFYKNMDKEALKILYAMYPQYKGFINLF